MAARLKNGDVTLGDIVLTDEQAREVFRLIDREYVEEDIRQCAEMMGVQLTDEEISVAAEYFMDNHDQTISNWSQMENHINNVLEGRSS